MREEIKVRNTKNFLFLVPFIYYALGLQFFITEYISEPVGQASAYLMSLLVIIGTTIILLTEPQIKKPLLINLWILFYLSYYSIGLLANIIHENPVPFLRTLIPFIFFLGFTFFLSEEYRRRIFLKSCLVIFTLANIVLVIFQKINYSIDVKGIYEYVLDRAGGVYGDANNAALVCLLSFVLIKNCYQAKNRNQRIVKILAQGTALYALLLTFSKTGFVLLILILAITYRKFFSLKRILYLVIVIPISVFFVFNFALGSKSLTDVQKDRIENVVSLVTFNTSNIDKSGRDELFENMLGFIKENPILGNGIYFSTEIRGHNTIFGVWADAGIICFILFISILLRYILKAFESPAKIKFLSISLLLVLIIYMITLQTIIDQPYLVAFFVFMCYLVETNGFNKKPSLLNADEEH